MTSAGNLTLWLSAAGEPMAARIAIGGDFLPAGRLEIPEGCEWRGMAHGLAGYFEDVSASIVNLESCLDTGKLRPRPLAGLGDIVSASADSLDYLKAVRAVAVGIANNHSFDFGSEGVARTRAAIAGRAMIPLGAGHTSNDSPEVLVYEVLEGVRVGFWTAATATLDPATPRKAGVEPATPERARRAREEMTRRGALVCVALLHAGCLRTNRPDPDQLRLMDSLARSGFHIVAASHSHRIGGYRQIIATDGSPSFCFYGLGSLVSGYSSSPLEREGLIVVAGLDRRGRMASLEVRPVALGTNGFGGIPASRASREILERFHALSEEVTDGSCERLFYRDISQGILRLYARDVKAAYRMGGVRALARKASRVRTRHVRRLVHRVIG
ncbi:MAG: CapA family protein [Candidatus Acidiferrales bacterium]